MFAPPAANFFVREKRKKEENYIKKGKKSLKNASFCAINSKMFAPPAANLFVGEKKLNLKREGEGGGNDQNAQYISLKCQYF